MVAVPQSPVPVPGLPAYDPADSLPLASACRLGLVPGHDGRRLSEDELWSWATAGVPVQAGGPRYLFPSRRDGRARRTTVAWCMAWVEFVASVRAAPPGPEPVAEGALPVLGSTA